MVFGRTTHKDQHGGCPVALDRVSKHGKPRRQLAVHPQVRVTPVAQKRCKLLKRERACGIFGNRGTCCHQARKCPARNMVDRDRIVLEDLAQKLAALAIDVARVEHVELLRHGKDLAKAVVATHDLAPVRALVLDRVVVELRKERIAVAHELVLIALRPNGFAVAQLHIAAHGTHHKVRNKRQPVGRLVKETLEGITVLSKVARGQTHRRQQRRNQAKIEPIQRADQYHVQQAVVEHVKLSRLRKHQLQALKEHPGQRGLQAFDGQCPPAHAVDGGTQRMALAREGLLPAGVYGRKIAQHVIALEPPVARADGIARSNGDDGVPVVGNVEPREQALERLAQVSHGVGKAIRNLEFLECGIPAVEDATHQNGQLLGAEGTER